MDKNKVLYLNGSAFSKELPSAGDKIDSIYIEGYASTNDVDRSDDVIPSSVWEEGMVNYLKNPIVLSFHDYDDPIGRVVEHRIDSTGLWIKARISAAAEVFSLVKDEVITAFSVGFRVLDAEYNSVAEVFVVKKLELVEISVVSIPCNQNTLFSLSKAFDNAAEYKSYKTQFTSKDTLAKELQTLPKLMGKTTKEWNMDPKELQAMLDLASQNAAENATKSLLASLAKERADKELAEKQDAALDLRVKAAVAANVQVMESGSEKLLAEVEKRFADQNATQKDILAGLEGALKEKAIEIAKLQTSKMEFAKDGSSDLTYTDRETAVLLSKMSGKSIDNTKFGRALIEKVGPHLPSAQWELEVSRNMEAEVRRRLVMAPLLRNIAMQTNVMSIPVNPEAGAATWVANSGFGTTASTGAAATHALKEITLNAYKLATLEYLNFEEEEDSLLVLLPIIRDAMVRRVARGMDRAYLRGTASGSDPVKGIATYDTSSAVYPSVTGAATMANLRAMRKDLGAWGLDPAEITYVVSTEVYYDLLEDVAFQTMNQVGVKATLLTGQIGSIGNSPVLVSGEFDTKASGAITASTNIGAICFASANFIAGNQRGLRFDTQDMVETQRKVLVASLRTGLTQTTTNLGPGVSTLRWAV